MMHAALSSKANSCIFTYGMKEDVIIIGAGISGLIAALELEKQGFSPVVLERNNEVGGRVVSQFVEEWPMDIGFQVVLTAYPAVQEYLDLNALDLFEFRPGAAVFQDGKMGILGDPLRHLPFLWKTLANPNIGLRDKWLTYRLQREVKRLTIDQLFQEPEQDTVSWLRSYGFSRAAIDYFFRPFFSGIFLEKELSTSSRMFRFVYKMFAEGSAAVPRSGIAQVPIQLKNRLKGTRFRLGTEVKSVRDGQVELSDGSTLEARVVLVACDPSEMDTSGSSLKAPSDWHRCQVFYAWIHGPFPHEEVIGLSATNSLVNNWNLVPLPRILEPFAERRLLSITVVDPPEDPDLFERVKDEMKSIAQIELSGQVKTYRIDRALPALNSVSNHYQSHRGGSLYQCGDHLYFPSLEAAMASGKQAATEIAQFLLGER